jgi:pimeloyl-ACP methyl ester carboxylesterase
VSLETDVEATHYVHDAQDGQAILVGHSYGGAVITEAGRHQRVAALVYLTAINMVFGDWLRTMPSVLRTFVLATIAVPIVIYGLTPYLHRLRVRLLS